MFLSGNVEALIISFISVCAALIFYDIFCAVSIGSRAAGIRKNAADNDAVARILSSPRKLRSEERLLTVEAALNRLRESDRELYSRYKETAAGTFSELLCKGNGKDDVITAYVLYLSAKYDLFYHTADEAVKRELLFMTTSENLYLRENALRCIYSTGDEELVYKALVRLDSCKMMRHYPFLPDGLKTFSGDRKKLMDRLSAHFPEFGADMQSVLTAFSQAANHAEIGR